MPVDPVCGMVVCEDEASVHTDYRGKHYCFCGDECKEEFDSDPDMFVVETVEVGYEDEDSF